MKLAGNARGGVLKGNFEQAAQPRQTSLINLKTKKPKLLHLGFFSFWSE
jgi:hypothetical protein